MHFSKRLNKGLEYLSSAQQKDGSFLSLSSPSEDNFSNAIIYQTTFLNIFILLFLTDLSKTDSLFIISKKLKTFLLSQKTEFWSWNYLTRDSLDSKNKIYPDGLDVTFCALTALSRYDKNLITSAIFVNIVQMLTATEKKKVVLTKHGWLKRMLQKYGGTLILRLMHKM